MLEVAIKDGQLETFRALMEEMVESTKANEPGALNYEWWINEAGTACHLYERYVDSAATMAHLGAFGTNYAERFMACVDMKRFIAYGNPDEQVRGALQGMGVKIMSPFGGFAR